MLTEMRDTCEMIMFDIDTMDKDNNASFPNEFIFRTLFFNQTFSFNFVQMNGIVNDFSLNNIFTYNSNNIVRVPSDQNLVCILVFALENLIP